VGNAWTVAEEDNKGAAEYWWTHALNSDETFKGIMDNCDFTGIGPLKGGEEVRKGRRWGCRFSTTLGGTEVMTESRYVLTPNLRFRKQYNFPP
jgi:serine carboxypeptidase-like clade II